MHFARDCRWSIRESTTVLASGLVVGGTTGAEWHQLRLAVRGRSAVGSIDGVKVGAATIVDATKGGAGSLGSSYDEAAFDNLTVAATPLGGE